MLCSVDVFPSPPGLLHREKQTSLSLACLIGDGPRGWGAYYVGCVKRLFSGTPKG